MARAKKCKAEKWTGLTLGQIAEIEANQFMARYSDSAERIAVLVMEKIRARGNYQRNGK